MLRTAFLFSTISHNSIEKSDEWTWVFTLYLYHVAVYILHSVYCVANKQFFGLDLFQQQKREYDSEFCKNDAAGC